ncbi:MAG: hypothetical protein Q7K43_00590, partial [Candidatus Woesearchaeota archaeon]|nr:hypothetical protein [Candidatus Woesearchaeota archaeon]
YLARTEAPREMGFTGHRGSEHGPVTTHQIKAPAAVQKILDGINNSSASTTFEPKTRDEKTKHYGKPTSDSLDMGVIIDKIKEARESRSTRKLLATLRNLFGNEITADDCIYFGKLENEGGPKPSEIYDICKMIQTNQIRNLGESGGAAIITAHTKGKPGDWLAYLNKNELQKLENMQKHTESEIVKIIDDEGLEGMIDEITMAAQDPSILFSLSIKTIMSEFADSVKTVTSKAKQAWNRTHQQQAEIITDVVRLMDDNLLAALPSDTMETPPSPPKEEKREITPQEDTVHKWREQTKKEDEALARSIEIDFESAKENFPIVVHNHRKVEPFMPTSVRLMQLRQEGLRQAHDDENLYEPTIQELDMENEKEYSRLRVQ